MRFRTEHERQAHIRAMWLLFLRMPSNEVPDVDNKFYLGEIGEAAPMEFQRMTPYSVALPKHEAPRQAADQGEVSGACLPGRSACRVVGGRRSCPAGAASG